MPWYGFKASHISYDERNQLKSDLQQLSSGYRTLQKTTARIRDKYETPELNYTDTLRWKSLLSFSGESDVVTPAALSKDIYSKSFPNVVKLRLISQKLIPIRENYLKDFLPEALNELDGKELQLKLNGQFSSFFSRLFNGEYKNLIAKIQMFIKDGNKPSYQQAVDFSSRLQAFQEVTREYHNTEETIRGFLGSGYKGPDSDWDHIISSLQKIESYHLEESASLGLLPRMSINEFSDYQKEFQEDAGELTKEINSIDEAKRRVMDMFLPEVLDLEKQSYNYCLSKIDGCLKEFDKLANWISFLDLLQKLDEMGLSLYIGLVIAKHIRTDEVVGAFRKLFYKQWIEYTIFSVPALASFTRINQDQAVLKFGEKDKLQYAISKEQIKAELSQQRPNLNMVAGGSAVAILRREGNKKRKQMPIRRLLMEISGLVQIIKPCFLMSPLSVSTFLDPEKISFDTVVFDEASQIFPQDAIGSIYRGKQIIVVGDSKQMPPSNFFNASTDIDYDDEEDYADITDFESILDICSAVFNTERLAWHYRSHYEQLIAFSNMNFYNNHLVTFPSSSTDHKGIGVDYYHVDGIFDRKSKTNRGEAEFIVELIYRHFEEHPERSLGVVAFSVAQQNLIDRLLSKKREEDPSYEGFFKNDVAEPFFIKNLETVQGDERDTIIFSVAYARDAQGRFIHNFGPLNRAGGERRLNVAITRAKDNVQLVSSIRYTDINLGNSSSEGVRLLRAYLDYAQNGEQALERTLNVPNEDHFDSYFEQEVCDYLRDQGFTVDTQVGCSGYKIDLGVRKPDSSHYVLAVECDGATYHSSRNARDRDSLRQRVLENMGWTFYRIWSTDWFRNKAVEKERLLNATRKALKKSELTEEYTSSSYMNNDSANTDKTVQERFVSEVQEAKHDFLKYTQKNALQILRDSQYWFDFHGAVRRLIEEEGPIAEEFLLKRIVYYFGKSKVTKTVLRDFNNKLYGCRGKGIIRKDGFLYSQDMDEIKLRVPGDKREIKYISIEELADGLYSLIQQNVTVSKDSLYKTLTSLLGFSRTSVTITSRYDQALSLLKAKGAVIEQEGLLSIL